MSLAPATAPCPCGTGRAYVACCGPLHDGEAADTAEQLMRSRYSAYALGRTDYVVRTWHPRTRPAAVDASEPRWLGLEVVRSDAGGPGDDIGVVEFRARFASAGGEQMLHETSRFERRRGRWVYVDGDVT